MFRKAVKALYIAFLIAVYVISWIVWDDILEFYSWIYESIFKWLTA